VARLAFPVGRATILVSLLGAGHALVPANLPLVEIERTAWVRINDSSSALLKKTARPFLYIGRPSDAKRRIVLGQMSTIDLDLLNLTRPKSKCDCDAMLLFIKLHHNLANSVQLQTKTSDANLSTTGEFGNRFHRQWF
jgi:hypothetical protein